MSNKHPCNVVEYAYKGEPGEKLLKRFFRKVKKSDIIREYVDKTSYWLTKSQKKRQKRLKNVFLRKKDLM